MTIRRSPDDGSPLTEAELPIIHLILNTDCNAWQLKAAAGSPGVCLFTGGDPLMPYDNHLEPALRHAAELGFAVNVHTNGLLLQDRFEELRPGVDVYSLAIDGPDEATANWFRGEGYFTRFTANVDLLAGHRKTIAFNTFTSPGSVGCRRSAP